MSQSQSSDAFISVRIVGMDHYMSDPIEGLDPLISDFRGYEIRKVPILRVFGATPAGQNTCLHLHGIFPYMFVPMPESENDGFIFRLASSIDKAINMSMNQSTSKTQHVYKAIKVSGRPFYGYHPRQHSFIKLYFYNPHMVRRAADLLAGGAVMDKALQPHESHVPFQLQFMMDYNLQGMNSIHLRHSVFRCGSLVDEYDDIEDFFTKKHNESKTVDVSMSGSIIDSSPHAAHLKVIPTERVFIVDSLPDTLILKNIARVSTTELEIDAVAADILNHNDLSEGGMNPGLKALWNDEKARREQLNISEPLTPPISPPRPKKASWKTESELFWYQRFIKTIEEKKLRDGIVSGGSTMGSADPDATVNIGSGGRSKKPNVYAVETPNEELKLLPDATQLEPHIPTLSQTFFNSSGLNVSSRRSGAFKPSFDDSCFDPDDTIVDQTVIASQFHNSCNEDDELVDLLAGLASEANVQQERGEKSKTNISDLVECSQDSDSTKDMFSSGNTRATTPSQSSTVGIGNSNAYLSQTFKPQLSDSAQKLRRTREMEERADDEAESLEMSQIIWDSAPILADQSRPNSSLWGDDQFDNSFFENLDIEDL